MNPNRTVAGRRWRPAWLAASLGVTSYVFLFLAVVAAASPLATPEVIEVTVASPVVSPGEPVLVEANVHNPSAREAETNVVLRVDEVSEEERKVRLPAGATQTLRFTVVRSEPGAHVVTAGSQAATFQVLAPQFLVRDLDIAPAVAVPGEPVLMRALVENVGAVPGVFKVSLAIDGVPVDLRTGLLRAGQSTTVSFETVPKVPGSYTAVIGDLPGALTVVAPTVDVRIPSSWRITELTTIAADRDGTRLTLTQDLVNLSTTSNAMQVSLPVALTPGRRLAYFQDSVSGIVYEDGRLTVPLRNDRYDEVARLVATSTLISDQATEVKLTLDKLVLLIPLAPLQLPSLPGARGPASFGMEVPIAGLSPDAPLRLTPTFGPTAKDRAAVELEARRQGKTLLEVMASASVEAPGQIAPRQSGVATVTFGVPSSWMESVEAGALGVALVGEGGSVELGPITEAFPAGTQTLLKAEVTKSTGTFALVKLARVAPPKIVKLVPLASVTVVGVPVEVRAIAEGITGTHAVLRVNNAPVAAEPVVELPDGTRGAIFYVTLRAVGVYAVAVEGTEVKVQAGLRDVVGHLQVSQFTIRPQQSAPGQTVQLKAVASNVGPDPVVSQVLLLVNGAPKEERWLAVSPGNTADLSFDLAGTRAGTYKVALLNARGEFTVVRKPVPATFQVSDLRVEPPTTEPGRPVEVTFALKNGGESAGTYLARMLVDKKERVRKEVVVGALTTLPVTFSLRSEAEGIFAVEVEGLRRFLVVISPEKRSDLVLETLVVEPPTVAGGEEVVATLTIRNRATTPASGLITVLVNGELVARKEVALEGRGRVQEKFVLIRDIPGLYDVEVRQGISADVITDIVKGQFLVTRGQSLASWEISRLEVAPQPAAPGEPLMIAFLLSNLGQQEGETVITVKVDGVQEAEEVLTLGPQSTKQVSIPLKGRPPGTYMVDVNGTETRFTVAGAAQQTPVLPATPGEAPSNLAASPVLFLALLGALVVILGGVYLFLRRGRTPT